MSGIKIHRTSLIIQAITFRDQTLSLDYLRTHRPAGLSFSFRSIDTDRDFTRDYLVSELARWGIHAIIEHHNTLEDVLIADVEHFNIDYKNLVYPALGTPAGYLNLYDYIKGKVNKRFTFGSLNPSPLANGMDLTVKPNGDVYLYGIENQRLGNIHFNHVRWEHLASYVRETPLVRALYTQPLSDLLARFDNMEPVQSILAKANNPYWLVKELANHDGLLEQLVPV